MEGKIYHKLKMREYRATNPQYRGYDRLYALARRLRKKGFNAKIVKGTLQISVSELQIIKEGKVSLKIE